MTIKFLDGIYLGTAKPSEGSGGGGGDSSIKILHAFNMLPAPVDGVYSVEWSVEKPDLQYDNYVSTFTLDNVSGGDYVFTAGDTKKDGVVTGVPHMVGWITLFDSSISTAFDLPTFTLAEGQYSAVVDGYSLKFGIEEDEGQINFVCDVVTKDGMEIGDWNIGFWNEELPVSKGSFDAENQLLTINYGYLVEKINASSVDASRKADIISLLNNSDAVIDMSVDVFEMMGVSSNIAWVLTKQGAGIGDDAYIMLFVSKTNPDTLKLAIGTDLPFYAFCSWNGLRSLFEVQGVEMTAEQIEAMFSQYVVDDHLCTVSGTLGNFSVEFD